MIGAKEKIVLGFHCLKTIFLRQKKPIIVSWSITDRCNLQCKYCSIWKNKHAELGIGEILNIIYELYKNGTKTIRFTGGEALLKEDIATIINYACNLGIGVNLTTNGILLPDKIEEVKRISGVTISLEGPEAIHDSIRGPGSYRKAIEAIKIAKKHNIRVSISATLNSLNIGCIENLLEIAKEFDSRIFFQPSTRTILYSKESNNLVLDKIRFESQVAYLIELKRHCEYIGNSTAGLEYLSHWPNKTNINCVAGKIMCRLDSLGNIRPCARFGYENNNLNVVEKGVKHCFQQLKSTACGNCWCFSMVELNLITAFNMSALVNGFKI